MNVIYYVLDSLRADHLSCYGYERETSPTMDALADEGVRFDHCVSPSTWTRPVAASILSGLYSAVHGTRTTEDLFDLASDPGEKEAVADEHPDRAARMRDLLDDWHEECEALRETLGTDTARTELDDEMRNQLEQLGYLS